jgi:hypothetical protein
MRAPITKTEKDKEVVAVLFSGIGSIGFTWLFAWTLNPSITSGTVWFIAALVSGIDMSFAKLFYRSKLN